MELGYVPLDRNGSAGSLTLEYAYDDWTIYNTALLAGNRSVADTYKKRASNYANVFDTSIGYARPRYTNGKFKEDFSLLSTHGKCLELFLLCPSRCQWYDSVEGRRASIHH